MGYGEISQSSFDTKASKQPLGHSTPTVSTKSYLRHLKFIFLTKNVSNKTIKLYQNSGTESFIAEILS